MVTALRAAFNLKVATIRAKFSPSPDLNFTPFYRDSFLEPFMEFEAEDSKLMKRFLDFQNKLKYVRAGNRGGHNKRLCGVQKQDLPQNNVGASNGYRLFYYSEIPGEIHFIAMFAKSDQKKLSSEDEKLFCAIVEKIKKDAEVRKQAANKNTKRG
jgi:hypothetical protein